MAASTKYYTVSDFENMVKLGDMIPPHSSILQLLVDLESQLQIVDYPVDHRAPSSSAYTNNKPLYFTRGEDSGDTSPIEPPSPSAAPRRRLAPPKVDLVRRPVTAPSLNSSMTSVSWIADKEEQKEAKYASNSAGASNPRLKTTTPEQWELIRSFKTTKLDNGKATGIDKLVNDIRITLNKLTPSTYPIQKEILIAHVSSYFYPGNGHAEGNDANGHANGADANGADAVASDTIIPVTDENTERIMKTIMDIVCNNRCYAEIYSNLIQELIQMEFDMFRIAVELMATSFVNMTKQIKYIDAEADYDGFCRYVKECDHRKAAAQFMVECVKRDLVNFGDVTDMVADLIDTVLTFKDVADKAKEVEELTEVIYVMVKGMDGRVIETTAWQESVEQEIARLAQFKAKDSRSLSNRAIFKYMDMIPGNKK
jgi:hypothetical protein